MVSLVLWLAATAFTLGNNGESHTRNCSALQGVSSLSSSSTGGGAPRTSSSSSSQHPNLTIRPPPLGPFGKQRVGMIHKFLSRKSSKLFFRRGNQNSSDVDDLMSDVHEQQQHQRHDTIAHDERVVFFPTAAKRIFLDQKDEQEELNNRINTSSQKEQAEETNGWEIPIHGWIFEPEEGSLRRRAVLALLRSALDRDDNDNNNNNNNSNDNNHEKEDNAKSKRRKNQSTLPDKKTPTDDSHSTNDKMLEVAAAAAVEDDEEEDNISGGDRSTKEILARRLRPFIVDNERGRTISIRIGNTIHRIPEMISSKNGHFHGILRLTDQEVEQALKEARPPNSGKDNRGKSKQNTQLRFEAVTDTTDERIFAGVTHLIPPSGGISVISDIDDTVKISHVTDKKKLVRSTFLQEFKAVPGMADVYQQWSKSSQHNAQFHFVSSSPYQLYEELSSFFRDAGFPDATFHLKAIRLKDRSLLTLFGDPEKTKIDTITSILQRYPHRQFVLVGDTGERDPEVYGHMLRQYPHQIQRVFLRDIPPKPIKKKSPNKNNKKTKRTSSKLTSKFKRNNNNNQDEDEGVHDDDNIDANNDFDISPEARLLNAFRGTPHEKWSLFTEGSTLHLTED